MANYLHIITDGIDTYVPEKNVIDSFIPIREISKDEEEGEVVYGFEYLNLFDIQNDKTTVKIDFKYNNEGFSGFGLSNSLYKNNNNIEGDKGGTSELDITNNGFSVLQSKVETDTNGEYIVANTYLGLENKGLGIYNNNDKVYIKFDADGLDTSKMENISGFHNIGDIITTYENYDDNDKYINITIQPKKVYKSDYPELYNILTARRSSYFYGPWDEFESIQKDSETILGKIISNICYGYTKNKVPVVGFLTITNNFSSREVTIHFYYKKYIYDVNTSDSSWNSIWLKKEICTVTYKNPQNNEYENNGIILYEKLRCIDSVWSFSLDAVVSSEYHTYDINSVQNEKLYYWDIVIDNNNDLIVVKSYSYRDININYEGKTSDDIAVPCSINSYIDKGGNKHNIIIAYNNQVSANTETSVRGIIYYVDISKKDDQNQRYNYSYALSSLNLGNKYSEYYTLINYKHRMNGLTKVYEDDNYVVYGLAKTSGYAIRFFNNTISYDLDKAIDSNYYHDNHEYAIDDRVPMDNNNYSGRYTDYVFEIKVDKDTGKVDSVNRDVISGGDSYRSIVFNKSLYVTSNNKIYIKNDNSITTILPNIQVSYIKQDNEGNYLVYSINSKNGTAGDYINIYNIGKDINNITKTKKELDRDYLKYNINGDWGSLNSRYYKNSTYTGSYSFANIIPIDNKDNNNIPSFYTIMSGYGGNSGTQTFLQYIDKYSAVPNAPGVYFPPSTLGIYNNIINFYIRAK